MREEGGMKETKEREEGGTRGEKRMEGKKNEAQACH